MIRMECTEVRDLLQPYADDELPPEERRAIAAHLGDCPACAKDLAALEALRHRIRMAGTHHLPAGLDRRVRALISATQNTSAERPWRRVTVLAASHMAAVVLGGVIVLVLMARTDSRERILNDVVSAHVRSLLTSQPTQIASADPHVIRPWFGGKVTYAPQVGALAGEGFPLLGARVDYVPPQAVAAIVYARRMHQITLFVLPKDQWWPGAAAETSRHGYNVVVWRDGGFSYYAVSDLNRPELELFAKLIRSTSTP